MVSLFEQEESQNQSGLATKPKGKITKGERVLLNKHTYVDLYEEYKARVAAGGSQALPQCAPGDTARDLVREIKHTFPELVDECIDTNE